MDCFTGNQQIDGHDQLSQVEIFVSGEWKAFLGSVAQDQVTHIFSSFNALIVYLENSADSNIALFLVLIWIVHLD